MAEAFTVVPVAHVVGGRVEPTDDHWGGSRCVIRVDAGMFGEDALLGLADFSHIEVVFRFHLTDPADLHPEPRHPRNNPAWPAGGIFAHRNMRRLNWLGVSRCRLLDVDGHDLHVEELDAVDGTPVLDIKPWFTEMGPRGDVRQPSWPTEMLTDYWAAPVDRAP
ncbi:SAM-dependent methyltransferase [Streptomyces marincola]|uniref:SAM-dependent methyltransferase n=1 Tax=Streptomyces marincola TaxID=2878388 RepID=UPI001CF4A235|nr:SAM-dependent methyltransferase [Streptomyces marincola]UCM91188.1 SAM-dependent methyltransferase [Streptomyces marincola]